MEKTWINANYFRNQLVVPCKRTAFYLKFAKMSLKMFRKRWAWWSLKISVGRKRIDLSPQPPSTTPAGRTGEQLLQSSLPDIQQMQVVPHFGGSVKASPRSLLVLQPQSTAAVVQGPQASRQLERTLCETLEMSEQLPAARRCKPPLESCSALWVKCLRHGTNRLLYTSVFKQLCF